MVVYIDIDETICTSKNKDYTKAIPLHANIKKANKFYEEGHTVIYWTARGMSSGKDWTELTIKQLNDWGVKYHKLNMNKPSYDLFIDDKALNTADWR